MAIGLGLTNSIAEKLKYVAESNEASILHPGDPITRTAKPFFHFPSFILFGFGIYARRFFFNNYLYLHQSYDEHRLNQLEASGKNLSPLVFSSYLDLFLSIFTGIMMSIIRMTLCERATDCDIF